MKNFIIILLLSCPILAHGQSSDTSLVKNLEIQMREAVLKGDTTAFFNLCAPELLVNNPSNLTVPFPLVKKFTRSGQIDYSTYEIKTEKLKIIDNLAISMGSEMVIPKGNTDHLGKTVTRRYTNIWMKRRGTWKLIARQATIINVQ